MATDNKRKDFEKPDVDEEYLMNIMSVTSLSLTNQFPNHKRK
jgi:hypothetical protein